MAQSNKQICVVEKTTGIKFEVTINNPELIVIYYSKYNLCYSAHPVEQIADDKFADAKLEYDNCRSGLTMSINCVVLEFNTDYQSQIPGIRYNHNLKQHQQCYDNASPADMADEFLSIIRNEQQNRVEYCIENKKIRNKLVKDGERIRKLEKELEKLKKSIPRLLELLGHQ